MMEEKRSLSAAHWMLRRGGSCFTRASLSGIKRIQVSSGELGRSRGTGHVSGLWIDYWHHDESSVVGQWIAGLGSFYLASDETLTEVTTWSTEEIQHTTPSERFGKIVGISFATSLGRHAQFFSQSTEQSVMIRYHVTPFEELVNHLLSSTYMGPANESPCGCQRDIVWAFNFRMDDIQIRLRARSSVAGSRLAFFVPDHVHSPHDLSEGISRIFRRYGSQESSSQEELNHEATLRHRIQRETLFWQELTHDGDIVKLTTINLIFDTHLLIGLEFQYELGLSRSFGSTIGERHAFELNPDERPSLLVIQESGCQIIGIEVCFFSCPAAM